MSIIRFGNYWCQIYICGTVLWTKPYYVTFLSLVFETSPYCLSQFPSILRHLGQRGLFEQAYLWHDSHTCTWWSHLSTFRSYSFKCLWNRWKLLVSPLLEHPTKVASHEVVMWCKRWSPMRYCNLFVDDYQPISNQLRSFAPSFLNLKILFMTKLV